MNILKVKAYKTFESVYLLVVKNINMILIQEICETEQESMKEIMYESTVRSLFIKKNLILLYGKPN